MKLSLLFLALLTLSTVSILGAAEWRALVIGNGDYPGKSLANPVNDAMLMCETLKGVGFQMTDVDLKWMRKVVRGWQPPRPSHTLITRLQGLVPSGGARSISRARAGVLLRGQTLRT